VLRSAEIRPFWPKIVQVALTRYYTYQGVERRPAIREVTYQED